MLLRDADAHEQAPCLRAAVLDANGPRGHSRERVGIPLPPHPERFAGARRVERRHQEWARPDGEELACHPAIVGGRRWLR